MKASNITLVGSLVALLPSTALANAGTPLMWATLFHMAIGNAVIGVIEGWLLAWMFKCSKWKAILILVAANYASAWAGSHYLVDYVASVPDITIQTVQWWCVRFIGVAFVVTLLVEYPFFWIALSSRKYAFGRALIATPVIHGISYSMLIGWYWMASGTSMMTGLDVVSVNEMKLPEPYALYFITPDGNQIVRMDMGGTGVSEPITAVAAHHPNDRLFVRPWSQTGYDLCVCLDTGVWGEETERRVLLDFAEMAYVDRYIAEDQSGKTSGTECNFGRVPTNTKESDWEFRTGGWPNDGIVGYNDKMGRRVHYAIETPFAAWKVRNATHVAGDFVVFQLGDDQICLLDPEHGRIALVARGKGPVVAKAKKSNQGADSTATHKGPPAVR